MTNNELCLVLCEKTENQAKMKDIYNNRSFIVKNVYGGIIYLCFKKDETKTNISEIVSGFFNPASNILDISLFYRDELKLNKMAVFFSINGKEYMVKKQNSQKKDILKMLS